MSYLGVLLLDVGLSRWVHHLDIGSFATAPKELVRDFRSDAEFRCPSYH